MLANSTIINHQKIIQNLWEIMKMSLRWTLTWVRAIVKTTRRTNRSTMCWFEKTKKTIRSWVVVLFFPCNGYSHLFPILILNDNKKTLILYVHCLLVTICVGLISTFEHVSLFVVLSTFFQIFIPAWSWYWVLLKDFCISLVSGLRLTIFWVVWGRSITLKNLQRSS